MCRTRCSLALLALSIGLVHSWDVAITTGDQIEFYTNKTKSGSVGTQFRDLTALAYDAVHSMLLFVDKQNDNASIFSYHIATKKYQSLVRRKPNENIQGVAFDPVTSMLFWTDTTERNISWISLKPGSKNGPYGNLFIHTENQSPRAIAVDSCRGYVYWTNINITKPTIERARLDGTDMEVVIDTDIHMPMSIVVDQHANKLYWVDDKEGIHYSIESSDLDGNNRYTLHTGINHQPNSLAVDKDFLYWVDWGYKKVWKLPKNAGKDEEKPEEITLFKNEVPFGIVANYHTQDQTEGVQGCENLRSLSPNKSAIDESFSLPPDMGLFCVHGIKIKGKLECTCSEGYTGDRCDVSICQNYCFEGKCSITSDGVNSKPTCSCPEGFSGDRCEINVCSGFCLNNGECLLKGENQPMCQCAADFEGTRCETQKLKTTIPPPTEAVVREYCNCTQALNAMSPVLQATSKSTSDNPSPTDGEFVMASSCNDGWDSVRDPVIMMLSILCGLLFLACAVLITKILQLKKRPRIKKRIIVNKNVTPMTARPDQCEITIENCCNMNICETPCFEPRSSIRPTLLDAKPGKEEKKNLIANMEYPDEY